MKWFFIRHAQTERDRDKVFRETHVELSSEGKKQALEVAGHIATLGIETLFSSPLPRAFQTAEILARVCHIPVHFDSLLTERRRPAELIGMAYDHPHAANILLEIERNTHDPTWHYADEENMYDLHSRATRWLSKYRSFDTGGAVLTVSHEVLLQHILYALQETEDFSPPAFDAWKKSHPIPNLQIIETEKVNSKWIVHSWRKK